MTTTARPGGASGIGLHQRPLGHTLTGALEAGIAAESRDLPTSGTAGASFYSRGERGTIRFVVDIDREVLIGAAFVGPEVADLLHAATIAIVAQVQLGVLRMRCRRSHAQRVVADIPRGVRARARLQAACREDARGGVTGVV